VRCTAKIREKTIKYREEGMGAGLELGINDLA
jgi:hypothetical protein